MRISQRREGDLLVLALDGELDQAGSVQLVPALRKTLLDCPGPVVCDLSGVTGFSRTALTVFPAVFAAVGGWPVVSFGLAAAHPPLVAALKRTGVARRVPVFRDVPSRRGQPFAGWRPQVLTRTAGLAGGPGAAAEAREVVASFCSAAGCSEDVVDSAKIVASELATNAVMHARPPIEMTLLATHDAITVLVRDRSSALPRAVLPHGAGGRGMAIVAAIATAWWSEPMADGKSVSARISLRRGR